jgi:hypothetical protein
MMATAGPTSLVQDETFLYSIPRTEWKQRRRPKDNTWPQPEQGKQNILSAENGAAALSSHLTNTPFNPPKIN